MTNDVMSLSFGCDYAHKLSYMLMMEICVRGGGSCVQKGVDHSKCLVYHQARPIAANTMFAGVTGR